MITGKSIIDELAQLNGSDVHVLDSYDAKVLVEYVNELSEQVGTFAEAVASLEISVNWLTNRVEELEEEVDDLGNQAHVSQFTDDGL